MAFKSYYHLQPCQLPKLDAGVASVRVMTTNGIQVLTPSVALPVTQVGAERASVGCYDYE